MAYLVDPDGRTASPLVVGRSAFLGRAAHGVSLPIGLQHHWDVSREFGMLATPIAYLVDERGTLSAPVAVGADEVLDLAESAQGVLG
jgi:hypothetical protein